MDEQTREMDFRIADLEAEVKRLRKIESAVRLMMKTFGSSMDYDAWDKALDALEIVLKEKA
jgi:N-methylhydantoinase B/oxoprolinase/acetone carboxylase alpha subunit